MTNKRFMLDDCGELIDLNNHKFVDYGEECCNLLNEQHETIQRLKQNIDELLSVNVEEELLKENEQLKEAVYSWSKSYTRVYEENKRLRRCMNEIYTIARLEEVD